VEAASLAEMKEDLLWAARRSSRYHSRRRQFFDRYRLFTSAVSALAGSAAIATVISSLGKEFTIIAGSIVTFFSILDMVVGSSRMARLHEDIYRRFVALEKDIVVLGESEWTEQKAKALTARRLEIEADEPPIKRVLDCLVYNELARAMNIADTKFVQIRWYQRILAQLIDVRPHALRIKESK
jgi:hypothetical protein